MRIKLKEFKQIVREEIKKLEESSLSEAPFGSVTSAGPSQRGARRFDNQFDDPMDVPEPSNFTPTTLSPQASRDATNALKQALRDLSAFNPKWHSFICRSKAGQEMSDIVIELESTLKSLVGELHEGTKFTADELRETIMKEAKKIGLAEAPFGGVTSAGPKQRGPKGFGDRRERERNTIGYESNDSIVMTKAKKLISDWLYLHNSFTPRIRRSMCLGKAGDRLALSLQTLDDMLAKL